MWKDQARKNLERKRRVIIMTDQEIKYCEQDVLATEELYRKQATFAYRAKGFWNRHSDAIISTAVGLAVVIGGLIISSKVSKINTKKSITIGLDEKLIEAASKTEYLGRNNLIISDVYYDLDKNPNKVSLMEFIANGVKLKDMGEFGEDVCDLLKLPNESTVSSWSIITIAEEVAAKNDDKSI